MTHYIVMAGLVPAIHGCSSQPRASAAKDVMPGTSPGMTNKGSVRSGLRVHAGLDRGKLGDHAGIGDAAETGHLAAVQRGRVIEHVERAQVVEAAVAVGVRLLV